MASDPDADSERQRRPKQRCASRGFYSGRGARACPPDQKAGQTLGAPRFSVCGLRFFGCEFAGGQGQRQSGPTSAGQAKNAFNVVRLRK